METTKSTRPDLAFSVSVTKFDRSFSEPGHARCTITFDAAMVREENGMKRPIWPSFDDSGHDRNPEFAGLAVSGVIYTEYATRAHLVASREYGFHLYSSAEHPIKLSEAERMTKLHRRLYNAIEKIEARYGAAKSFGQFCAYVADVTRAKSVWLPYEDERGTIKGFYEVSNIAESIDSLTYRTVRRLREWAGRDVEIPADRE